MSASGSGKESSRYAFARCASAEPICSFHVRGSRAFRTSPGCRRFPRDRSKVLAQMRLIDKSAFKRNVAQRHIGLKHVPSSQFDATPDHKGVWGVPECAPKGARKVRFAAPHQHAQICDEHATGDMPVDMVEHLPCLPCQQTLFPVVRGPFHRLWINLSSQHRGCLEYCAMRRLFPVKVTDGHIQQRYHMVHPAARSALTDLRTGLRFEGLCLHCGGTVSAHEHEVDRELQWTKAPSIEGLPHSNRRRHILYRMRCLHALCAALCLIGDAVASTPLLDSTQYSHTSFGPAQGAPARTAALAQTSDGFLWLSTSGGLYRFDGVRFERIAAVGGVPLLHDFVTALEAPQSGGLWIGYQYGGASFLDSRGLKNYPTQNGGLPNGTLESFAIDPDGVVWAGTTRGLARLVGQRWTDVTQTVGLPSPNATNVMVDKSGDLWIESADRLALLRRGSSRVHVYDLPAYQGLVRDPDGRVWNMAGNCLYLLDPTRDDTPPCRHLPPAHTEFWLIDRAGHLWAGNDTRGVSVLTIPSLDRDRAAVAEHQAMPDPRFLPFASGPANCALQDREGNFWFGTTGGLEQLRVPRLRRYGPFPEFVVLGTGNHNSLWVATTHFMPVPDEDFFQLKEGRMVPYRGGPTQITASYRDATGVLWVGGYGRLWKLDDSTWKEIATPPREPADAAGDTLRRTQAIARDARGDLWLSVVRVGLFRLRDHGWERVSVPGIPASDYPFVIYADGEGSIWLGYSQSRLASLKSDAWRLYTEKEGIKVGAVQILARINDQLWIGGEQGLQRVHSDHFESIPALSALGNVTGLLQAKNGDLWLHTSFGGVHVTRQELTRSEAAPAQTLAYEKFDTLDGLPGMASGLRPMPTVLESDDGRIWFEADDRFSSIDPSEHVKNTITPEVIIGSVTDDGRHREPAASLTLFPNVRNVAIDYTATSLSIPNRVRFKYRLENFDESWQEAGTRRTAYYNNLPPGRHVFQVIAANDDGVWNSQGAAVALIVPPVFYQTLLFRVVFVALAIVLLAALFFGRLHQVTARDRKRLEQRMEDRLNERTRIARELHDSLLQGFQGLMFRLQAVRQLLPGRAGDAAKSLDSALQLGDQAIVEGRGAVENLRAASFDGRDLITSLKTLGAELGVEIERQSETHYGLVVEGRPRQLTPLVRDEAYRIVREAVRNAYHHANAHHIETEVTFGDAELSMRVRDDGVGIDPQILARGRRSGHWGLTGMRERSETLGGQLHVWSERNAGTEVELRIPAEIAYSEPRRSLFTRLKNRLRSSR
jgi:signal transduction histidine kinase/ligand-binding sensor domain-containing protein